MANMTFTNEEIEKMERMRDKFMGKSKSKKYEYPEVVIGEYLCTINKMEIIPWKNEGQFALDLRLTIEDGFDDATKEYVKSWPGKNKPKINLKRPINKTNNDALCFGWVWGLVSRFNCDEIIPLENDLELFASHVKESFEYARDRFAYRVKYNGATPFNRLEVLEVFYLGDEGEDDGNNIDEDYGKDTKDEVANGEDNGEENGEVAPQSNNFPQMNTSYPLNASESSAFSEFINDGFDDEEDLPF